jgi:hypothetical protein
MEDNPDGYYEDPGVGAGDDEDGADNADQGVGGEGADAAEEDDPLLEELHVVEDLNEEDEDVKEYVVEEIEEEQEQ